MGISGLLPLLKPIQRSIHIREYRGKTVGVDAYSWLHKGGFSCAFELAMGSPTLKYVDYCMRKVDLMLKEGIVPFIVFDGGYLPMKQKTETSRRL